MRGEDVHRDVKRTVALIIFQRLFIYAREGNPYANVFFSVRIRPELDDRALNRGTHMVWIDYAIIAVIGFSCLVSLIRGFVREALSLVTWGCALLPVITTLTCLSGSRALKMNWSEMESPSRCCLSRR